MSENESSFGFRLGLSLIIAGLVANKWALERILVPGQQITMPGSIAIIVTAQALLILSGLYLAIVAPKMKPPSKSGLAAMLISTLFSLLIAEGLVRGWLYSFAQRDQFRQFALYSNIPHDNRVWSPHHYLCYYPTPNYKSGLTSHNSMGYRGPEISREKPHGIYRVVTVGGSTTYTIKVLDNDKTFPRQLERLLRARSGQNKIEVINAGVGGYNSWETLANIQFRVLDLDPDLILVYHGTNDVHTRLVPPEAYVGDNSGRRRAWTSPEIPILDRSALWRVFTRKFGITRQVGLFSFIGTPTYYGAGTPNWVEFRDQARAMLTSNTTVYFKRNLLNMAAVSTANGAKIAYATWAHSPHFEDYAATDEYQQGFRENNKAVKEVATQVKAHLFDFATAMPKDKRYWADGRHVNEEGALLKAQLFAKFLEQSGLESEWLPRQDGGEKPPQDK